MVSYLGDSVNISDLSLGTSGSGDDTQITVGGNIAPELRIEYGAGVFSAISEMKVRYELIPRLYPQTVSDVNQAIVRSISSTLIPASRNKPRSSPKGH